MLSFEAAWNSVRNSATADRELAAAQASGQAAVDQLEYGRSVQASMAVQISTFLYLFREGG